MTLFNFSYLPKALSPTTVTWGVENLTYIHLGGGEHSSLHSTVFCQKMVRINMCICHVCTWNEVPSAAPSARPSSWMALPRPLTRIVCLGSESRQDCLLSVSWFFTHTRSQGWYFHSTFIFSPQPPHLLRPVCEHEPWGNQKELLGRNVGGL